ncbi:MAG: hypothetical protein DI598_04430 [Pseudopedobacter saltans]|uniref:Uncharacterized protein n=1 Tax=Pseudopedobacter saltans TaxID=151895 RepID=A0A2W5F812_9SPHI|nr:MAG: hypothetical protein DI598_04430 [Pseudopedobacter saltans]
MVAFGQKTQLRHFFHFAVRRKSGENTRANVYILLFLALLLQEKGWDEVKKLKSHCVMQWLSKNPICF